MNGESIHVLGTIVSPVSDKGSPPLGFWAPIHYHSTMQDCLGARWERTRGGKSTQERKQGISSTSCLVGDAFPTPQTKNRGLLFELSFHICGVLLDFRFKDTIYHSSKKYKVPRNRPKKTVMKYL